MSLRVFLLIVCLGCPALYAGEDIQIQISEPLASTTVPAGTSVRDIVKNLQAGLEGERETHTSKGWVDWVRHEIKKKFNFRNRIRIGTRDTNNAPPGTVVAVPYSVIAANSIAAMIGIHALESVVIGPLVLTAGLNMESWWGYPLIVYGGMLIIPTPTGTPVDLISETFCLITAGLLFLKPVQVGMYKVELVALRIVSPLAKILGLPKLYNAFFDSPKGQERLAKHIALHSGDNRVVLTDPLGRALVQLHVEPIESGNIRLTRFRLEPESETALGRAHLARALSLFGRDIRDAVLNPKLLLAGKHGTQVDEREFQVIGNSVQLKQAFFVRKGGPSSKCALALEDSSQL